MLHRIRVYQDYSVQKYNLEASTQVSYLSLLIFEQQILQLVITL